jgi:hypothetical protein
MPLRFASSEAERAFQLHYGAMPVTIGLVIAVMGACVHVAYIFQGVLLPDARSTAAFNTQQTVLSMASIMLYLGHYALLGKQHFILHRGFHSVWHRVLHATGLLSWIKPGGCAAAVYCQLMWQHRLFLVHFVGAITRIPVGWYWSGGIMSWLAMATVDVLDPGRGCGQSPSCLISALQTQAAGDKWLLLHNIMATTLRSSRVFALDVVLPGLLLTWLELRARRAWWQQQQARQQQALRQLRSEAAANKKQQAEAACKSRQLTAATSAERGSCKVPAAAALVPTQTKPQLQQQQQHHCSSSVALRDTHAEPASVHPRTEAAAAAGSAAAAGAATLAPAAARIAPPPAPAAAAVTAPTPHATRCCTAALLAGGWSPSSLQQRQEVRAMPVGQAAQICLLFNVCCWRTRCRLHTAKPALEERRSLKLAALIKHPLIQTCNLLLQH